MGVLGAGGGVAGAGSDNDLTRHHERSDIQLSQQTPMNSNVSVSVRSSVEAEEEPDYANIPPPGAVFHGLQANGYQAGNSLDSNTSAGMLKDDIQMRPRYPDYDSEFSFSLTLSYYFLVMIV